MSVDRRGDDPTPASTGDRRTPEPDHARLRAGVLEEARRRRLPGRWCGRITPISPAEAYRRAVRQLDALLAGLAPHDWARPARHARPAPPARPARHAGPAGRPWTVREVTAHLIGADEYTGAVLGLWPSSVPPEHELDHVAATAGTMAELADVPASQLHRRWRTTAARLQAHLATRPDDSSMVRFYGLPISVADLAVVRSFEVWAHSEDIGGAVGQPVPAPDPSRMALMTELAVRLLPVGLLSVDRSVAGATARVVLTGPGGGTWDQALALGESPGAPDVVVVVDALEFCRHVGHGTLAPDDVHSEGDPALVPPLLAGSAAFAE